MVKLGYSKFEVFALVVSYEDFEASLVKSARDLLFGEKLFGLREVEQDLDVFFTAFTKGVLSESLIEKAVFGLWSSQSIHFLVLN